MYKVSVIIPIYNVEKYIERCVRSLMEQTLDEVQYIFVNDATPDASMSVLQNTLSDYPKRLPDVLVLEHDGNKGLPTARMTGLAMAKGDYIIHCDSDDYVDPNMYGVMYEKAVADDLDIVASGYYEGSGGDWHVHMAHGRSMDMVTNLLELRCSVWNKMIRRTLAKRSAVVSPKKNMGEDLALMVQYAVNADRYDYIDIPLYYYDRHSSSILGNRTPEALLDRQSQLVDNVNIAIDAISESGAYEKYEDQILHVYVYVKNYILPALPYTKSYHLWKNTYKCANSKVLLSKMFTLREKLNFTLTYFGLYPVYYKLIHKNA